MANYPLANSMVDDIMIVMHDDGGAIIPAPDGDVFSASSSDVAVVNAIIGTMPSGPNAGAPSLRMNAIKALSASPVTVTISDDKGDKSFELLVDVVAGVVPGTIALDVAGVVHTPQAIPAA